jgi:hypothetical protein
LISFLQHRPKSPLTQATLDKLGSRCAKLLRIDGDGTKYIHQYATKYYAEPTIAARRMSKDLKFRKTRENQKVTEQGGPLRFDYDSVESDADDE